MHQAVQTIVQGLLLGGVYALASSGLSLVFGVMNVINVAHGAMLILAAYLSWELWTRAGIDPIVGALVTTPVMFAFGWITYQGLIRRARNAAASTSVLLTFALAIMLEGLMGLGFKNVYRSVTPSYYNRSFKVAGIYIGEARLYACGAALVVLVGLWLVLTRTWAGRAIRASSQNPQGAQLMGIDVGAIAALTFALGIATTGAGGSLISVLYPFFPASHYLWITRLLAIIVLGGMGSLGGAVIGALLMGVAESLVAVYWDTSWVTGVPYAVIFVILLVRPQGILGTRTREDVAAA